MESEAVVRAIISAEDVVEETFSLARQLILVVARTMSITENSMWSSLGIFPVTCRRFVRGG